MPNTLTNLYPTIYKALDVVSRELIGFIPAVQKDAQAAQASVGQTVRFPIVPAMAAGDVAAAATGPDPADQTIPSATLSITKSRNVTFYWTGEEGGIAMKSEILRDQFAQAMRTLANEIEADLAAVAYKNASRWIGTAGTPPFGSDFNLLADLRKILDDNGCPAGERAFIMNTAAGANLRKLATLYKVNESGSDATLRRGVLLDIHAFALRESAQVKQHAQAAAASYVTNGIQAAGATSIVVATGANPISAGSLISFAADTANKYVVVEDYAGGAGNLKIGGPGLIVQIPTGNAITVNTTTFGAHVGFTRSAIVLAARVPKMPEGGDAADDVMAATDPVSGITFQIAEYRQRRRIAYEVSAAWGVAATKSAHIALLAG